MFVASEEPDLNARGAVRKSPEFLLLSSAPASGGVLAEAGGPTATSATSHGTCAESGALTPDVSCSVKQRPQCGHGFRQAFCFEGCEEFFNGLRWILETSAMRFGGIDNNIGSQVDQLQNE